VEIEDHGIKLRLTIVDTPGFNDMVDASQWYEYSLSGCKNDPWCISVIKVSQTCFANILL